MDIPPSNQRNRSSVTSSVFRQVLRIGRRSVVRASVGSADTNLPRYSAALAFPQPQSTSSTAGGIPGRSLETASIASSTPTYSTLPRANALLSASPSYTTLPAPDASQRRISTSVSEEHHHEVGEDMTVHLFHLRSLFSGSKSTPWATFSVVGGERHNCYPKFHTGDYIRGSVHLNLESPQAVSSIQILLKGKLITSYLGGSYPFLEYAITLWDRGAGNPRVPTSSKRFTGNFVGQYDFPFKFPFPSHVDLSTLLPVMTIGGPQLGSEINPFLIDQPSTKVNDPPSTLREKGHQATNPVNLRGSSASSPTLPVVPSQPSRRNPTSWGDLQSDTQTLPPSFLEKNVNSNMQYELVLIISHGRFRNDSRLKTVILYTPSFWPPPSSNGRQTSYREGALLRGPILDPDGWYPFSPVKIKGTLQRASEVEVECVLSLAQPLVYARGTVIPLHLSMTCQNTSALDYVANPKSIQVRLSRLINYEKGAVDGESQINMSSIHSLSSVISTGEPPIAARIKKDRSKSSQSSASLPTAVPISSLTASDVLPPTKEFLLNPSHKETVGSAIWWVPPKDVTQERDRRFMEGEVHLPPDLQPSCGFAPFTIQYAIELLPFASPAFEPAALPIGKVDLDGFSTSDSVLLNEDPMRQIYLSESVVIATTCNPDEPVPKAFTEPQRARRRT
ncbi:hypothetical protein FA15DRAFT_620797 [Coprinopsis marcescibilis]|uniref:Arrestin-like N-terminal domain-containing protein n=1 Tax=Coprinopsis marcescibilis TaxID=230819 RepID=A0A5C3KSN0_COPMA|nr:hypothetical protein FA15DRAFT_620797 [Coprinopsis marcescibilis]